MEHWAARLGVKSEELRITRQILIAQDALIPGPATHAFEEGHVLDAPGAIERAADALRRGRACTFDFYGSFDPFDYADRSIEELLSEWNIPAKTTPASE